MMVRRAQTKNSLEFGRLLDGKSTEVKSHPGFMSVSPRSSDCSSGVRRSKGCSYTAGYSSVVDPARPSASTSKGIKKHHYNSNIEKEALSPKDRYHSKCVNSSHHTSPTVNNKTAPKTPSLSPKPKQVDRQMSQQNPQCELLVLKEKYSKLKEDYNKKVEEVSSARVELEGAIKEAVERHRRFEDTEKQAADLTLRVKEAEFEKIKCSSSRDRILEMENQLALAKNKYSKSLQDVSEAQEILKQQLEAVEKTRELYLETEQLAEEQNRKLGMLESENERLSEQITLRMDQAREQFQLQMFELGPLADSVTRLNESIMITKGKKSQADKITEQLQTEIHQLTNKNKTLKSKVAELEKQSSLIDKEKVSLRQTIDDNHEERTLAKAENYALRSKIRDLEELNVEKEMNAQLKETEVKNLSASLETLREECARQISSNKSEFVNARKSHLKRLSSLEKDLVRTKADERSAQKERDEIQLRLEDQITSLSLNLIQAQSKISILQDSLGSMSKDRKIMVKRICSPRRNR